MVKGSRLWIGHSSLVCKWPLAGFGPIQEVARQQLVSTCCTESLALIHKRWKHQGGKAACHQHWKSTLPGHTSKNHCHRQPRRPHLHCSKLYQSSKCKNWHIPCQGRSTCGFCESHLKLLGESMWVDQMASGLEEVGVGYQNAHVLHGHSSHEALLIGWQFAMGTTILPGSFMHSFQGPTCWELLKFDEAIKIVQSPLVLGLHVILKTSCNCCCQSSFH